MCRLFVLVEGQTEETFVNEILEPHLFGIGFLDVKAKLIGNSRQRANRGGIRSWPGVCKEIVRHLRQDQGIHVTTMVDFHGLPADSWPGRTAAVTLPLDQKAPRIESEIAAVVQSEMGPSWNPSRFIPFVLMHEFEGLLFSDCDRFASAIGEAALASRFQAIRGGFGTPEDINDSPETHPSKRILQHFPQYQKPFHGNLAVLEIGFAAIRAECPHFREWLQRLEAVAAPAP